MSPRTRPSCAVACSQMNTSAPAPRPMAPPREVVVMVAATVSAESAAK